MSIENFSPDSNTEGMRRYTTLIGYINQLQQLYDLTGHDFHNYTIHPNDDSAFAQRVRQFTDAIGQFAVTPDLTSFGDQAFGFSVPFDEKYKNRKIVYFLNPEKQLQYIVLPILKTVDLWAPITNAEFYSADLFRSQYKDAVTFAAADLLLCTDDNRKSTIKNRKGYFGQLLAKMTSDTQIMIGQLLDQNSKLFPTDRDKADVVDLVTDALEKTISDFLPILAGDRKTLMTPENVELTTALNAHYIVGNVLEMERQDDALDVVDSRDSDGIGTVVVRDINPWYQPCGQMTGDFSFTVTYGKDGKIDYAPQSPEAQRDYDKLVKDSIAIAKNLLSAHAFDALLTIAYKLGFKKEHVIGLFHNKTTQNLEVLKGSLYDLSRDNFIVTVQCFVANATWRLGTMLQAIDQILQLDQSVDFDKHRSQIGNIIDARTALAMSTQSLLVQARDDEYYSGIVARDIHQAEAMAFLKKDRTEPDEGKTMLPETKINPVVIVARFKKLIAEFNIPTDDEKNELLQQFDQVKSLPAYNNLSADAQKKLEEQFSISDADIEQLKKIMQRPDPPNNTQSVRVRFTGFCMLESDMKNVLKVHAKPFKIVDIIAARLRSDGELAKHLHIHTGMEFGEPTVDAAAGSESSIPYSVYIEFLPKNN